MPANMERLLDDRSGSSAVEYGLVVAVIALVILLTLMQIGEFVQRQFLELAEIIIREVSR